LKQLDASIKTMSGEGNASPQSKRKVGKDIVLVLRIALEDGKRDLLVSAVVCRLGSVAYSMHRAFPFGVWHAMPSSSALPQQRVGTTLRSNEYAATTVFVLHRRWPHSHTHPFTTLSLTKIRLIPSPNWQVPTGGDPRQLAEEFAGTVPGGLTPSKLDNLTKYIQHNIARLPKKKKEKKKKAKASAAASPAPPPPPTTTAADAQKKLDFESPQRNNGNGDGGDDGDASASATTAASPSPAAAASDVGGGGVSATKELRALLNGASNALIGGRKMKKKYVTALIAAVMTTQDAAVVLSRVKALDVAAHGEAHPHVAVEATSTDDVVAALAAAVDAAAGGGDATTTTTTTTAAAAAAETEQGDSAETMAASTQKILEEAGGSPEETLRMMQELQSSGRRFSTVQVRSATVAM
jgi:hypothetical protein